MRKNRAIIRCIIVITVVMVLGILGIGNIAADGPGGPHVIAGIVYDSDGKDPGDGYEGAYAAVIIEHKGAKTTYADPNGLEQDENDDYWYVVTIPEGAWDMDDTYWVWVDGSGWGDTNFTCRGDGDPDVNSWKITSGGSERRDVRTADYNFKPLIAWIFAIILAVVGIVIGILRPLRIPFSGRPRQPSDLVDEIMIIGTAEMPGELPKEEAAAPAEEERICSTCGGKLEYIPEYGSWYCYACKKYSEEEEAPPEEELPPPDELAPPEEEPPPPEEPEPPSEEPPKELGGEPPEGGA